MVVFTYLLTHLMICKIYSSVLHTPGVDCWPVSHQPQNLYKLYSIAYSFSLLSLGTSLQLPNIFPQVEAVNNSLQMTNLQAEITAGQQRFDSTVQNIQTQVNSNLDSNSSMRWSPLLHLKPRCNRTGRRVPGLHCSQMCFTSAWMDCEA